MKKRAEYLAEGDTLFKTRQYSKAVEAYSRAIDQSPSEAHGYYRRASAYYYLQDTFSYINDIMRALFLDPTEAIGYYNLDQACADLEPHEKEIALRYTGLQPIVNPKSARDYHVRGVMFKEIYQQYSRAIADFDRALELDSSLESVYVDRAFAYEDIGAYDKAIADYTHLINKRPTDEMLYYTRGTLHLNTTVVSMIE